MTSFALPHKFALVFNPHPEEPSELREWAMFFAGVILGLILATAFPIRF